MSDTATGRISLIKRIKLYRCLQVLEKQMNHALSKRIIPVLVIQAPMMQIIVSFVFIKLASSLPSEGFLSYPFIIIMVGSSCMIFETFAAQFGEKSTNLCHNWLMEKGIAKVNVKRIRSLQSMRIKVGSNFIDGGTALVTQDFCLNQTVSLLLM